MEIIMSAKIVGLGHVGLYVKDLDKMTEFYRDFLGMTITKRNANSTFFSSDPSRSDHEVVVVKGARPAETPLLINQISLRVATLADLRDFYYRIKAKGFSIQRLVTHVSAIGCYFLDPEANITEVFWLTGVPSWVNIAIPIDIERSDAAVLADVHRYWEKVRHVQVGELPDAQTEAEIRALVAVGTAQAPHNAPRSAVKSG